MKKFFNIKSKSDMTSDSEVSSESELDEDFDENELGEKRAEIFIHSIVEYFESKFKEYEKIADVDGVAKEIKFMGLEIPKTGNKISVPSTLLALIGLLIKCLQTLLTYIVQKVLGKSHRRKAKILTRIFGSLSHEERHAIFANTGADIYYSFQYQLNQIADVDDYSKRGLKKVAKDARDRAIRYLRNSDKKSIGTITPEILTKAVFLGTPKSMYGHTVKLTRSKKELKTSDLFGILGLKVMYANFGIMYYYKNTLDGSVGASACEYRFAFDWERKGRWEQDYKNVEGIESTIDANNFIERSSLQKAVANVLKEFKDSRSQREEIASGVRNIVGGVNHITSAVNRVEGCINQVGVEVDHIEEGVNHIKSDVKCIRQGVSQLIDRASDREDYIKSPLKNFQFNFTEPVANYTGRKRELKDLHDLLVENAQNVVITQCAVITGLGGIGKTELARKYASTYATKFYDGNIIWIDCETENSRKESFEKLAEELGVRVQKSIENQEKLSEIEVLRKVYERLSLTKSLIIYDNTEKYEDIKQYLLQSSIGGKTRPTILITSRSGNWEVEEEGCIKPLPLNVFAEHEALSFVKKKLKIPENETFFDEKIGNLVNLLSRFPLALRTAIGFLNSGRIKVTENNLSERIEEYIELYQKNDEKCLKFSSSRDRYEKTVYNTWRITFDRIKNEEYGENAIALMEIIAYCRPDDIDFYDGMNHQQREDKSEIRKQEEVWMLLSEYSLITIVKIGPVLSARVHRFVQQVVKMWLREEKTEERILRKFLNGIDEEYVFLKVDIWDFASEYSSLIDDFAVNYQVFRLIYELTFDRKYQAADNIIRRLEELESINPNFSWRKMLEINRISNYMIRHSEYFDELARNLCIFYAYFRRNLLTANSLTSFDNFLTKFSKRFDKTILLETWYDSEKPPLHSAVLIRNIKLVEWLLKKGANRTAPGRYGQTAIHCTASRLSAAVDLLRLLVRNTDECNCRNRQGETPLHLAALHNVDKVKFLLNNGADPTIADNEGRTAMHLAARSGEVHLLKLFNLNAKKCNSQTKNGETLLHYASDLWLKDRNIRQFFRLDSGNIYEFLLKSGADPRICDNQGRNAIWPILQYGSIEAIGLLLEREFLTSSTKFKNGQSLLHVAVASGNIEKINIVLKMGVDVNCADDHGGQPLHLTFEFPDCSFEDGKSDYSFDSYDSEEALESFNSECRHFKIANLLIKNGANVNCADNDGVKLIHLASQYGHLNIIKLCAKSGCDCESTTETGRTPLHYAAERGNLKVVKFLVDERRVKPNPLDNKKMTPVAAALLRGYQQIVEVFLERKLFDVNEKLPNGRYPLQLALDSGNYNLVRILIDRGADSKLSGEDGVKVVHLAAKAGDLNFLRCIVDDKNVLGYRTTDGRIPLHFACGGDSNANENAVEFLLENTPDPNAADVNGLPAFAYAIQRSNFHFVKNFLDLKIDLKAYFNAIGITPLIHALITPNKRYTLKKDVINLLLNPKYFSVDPAGYDDTLLGKLQISALHVAAYVGNFEAVKVLTYSYKMDVNSGLHVSWTPLQAAARYPWIASFLANLGAKIAEDNSSVYRNIIQDFLNEPNNRKLVDSYTRILDNTFYLDVRRIKKFLETFS